MKLTSRTKKLLLLAVFAVILVSAAGCAVPHDENNQIIYIWNEQLNNGYTYRTSFSDVMANENWFNAIFVWPLSWLINQLSGPLSVGGAIAAVTIAVNGILALATIKSSIAQQQMQLIQPELERIQRKYEGRDDETSKMRQAQEMQQLYRKYDINPGSVLLVTFLQLPIIMAMYMAVHRSWAVYSGTFLGMSLQQTPLAGMQRILTGDMAGIGYLILFLFMGASQFLSMKLPEMIKNKKEAEKHSKRRNQPESGGQGKFMQYYMLIMIMVFGLMWPAAMSLYWAINSLVQIAKTLITQKIIDDRQVKGARA